MIIIFHLISRILILSFLILIIFNSTAYTFETDLFDLEGNRINIISLNPGEFSREINNDQSVSICSDIYKLNIEGAETIQFILSTSAEKADILDKYQFCYSYEPEFNNEDWQLLNTGIIDNLSGGNSTIYIKFRFIHDLKIRADNYQINISIYKIN